MVSPLVFVNLNLIQHCANTSNVCQSGAEFLWNYSHGNKFVTRWNWVTGDFAFWMAESILYFRLVEFTVAKISGGAIHSTKIPTGPTGKIGPPQKVDPFFRNFSGWTEPIHWVLDRNFRKFWLNGWRPGTVTEDRERKWPMNDFQLIEDPCYAHRILGSPGGNIASRYKQMYGVIVVSVSVKSSVFGRRITHFRRDFVRSGGGQCCCVEVSVWLMR